jgi:hypothetical protein
MNFLTVVLIDVVLGALDGVGIFFSQRVKFPFRVRSGRKLKVPNR